MIRIRGICIPGVLSCVRNDGGACMHVQKRFFGYEDTLAAKLYGRKELVMVIHPIFKRKPILDILYDAEEALGLARAAKWDVLPGPTEPKDGWDYGMLNEVEHIKALKDEQRLALPSDWHVDRGSETDDEYDLDDLQWRSGDLRRQWAESTLVPVRDINPHTLFQRGKLEELAQIYAKQPSHYVFINCQLTPSQQQNIEITFSNALETWRKQLYQETRVAAKYPDMRMTQEEIEEIQNARSDAVKHIPTFVEVIDRQRIVLEIFSLRAKSREAKTQILLAKMNYLRTRLTPNSQTRLRMITKINYEPDSIGKTEQLRNWIQDCTVQWIADHEGADTYEKFEKQMIEEAMHKLTVAQNNVKKTRSLHRQGRKGTPTIALVGYTNAGKTALMNKLTGAELTSRDMLFQTLDTTFKRVRFQSGAAAILLDSIGFIQDLPHSLYDAFKATIEEMLEADVLLHVRDISHPQTEMQKQTVIQTLHDAGMSIEKIESCMIEVWNKIDLLDEDHLSELHEELPPSAVPICAKDGTGIDMLLQVTEQLCNALMARVTSTLPIPIKEVSERLTFLRKSCQVTVLDHAYATSQDGRIFFADAIMDDASLAKYEKRYGPVDDALLQLRPQVYE